MLEISALNSFINFFFLYLSVKMCAQNFTSHFCLYNFMTSYNHFMQFSYCHILICSDAFFRFVKKVIKNKSHSTISFLCSLWTPVLLFKESQYHFETFVGPSVYDLLTDFHGPLTFCIWRERAHRINFSLAGFWIGAALLKMCNKNIQAKSILLQNHHRLMTVLPLLEIHPSQHRHVSAFKACE